MGLSGYFGFSPEPTNVSSSPSTSSFTQFGVKELNEFFGLHIRSSDSLLYSLPFSPEDITAGSENEYQAVVIGTKEHVDLPLTLQSSNFYKNIVRRARIGKNQSKMITELEDFVSSSGSDVWENSWVRFPRCLLSPFANQVFAYDLRANKKDLSSPERKDIGKFLFSKNGEEWVRIPVSYLLRLAVADVISGGSSTHFLIRQAGEGILENFLNDNTSPETFSFKVLHLHPSSHMGLAVGREAAKRFLFTQLLTMYANHKFGLIAAGQRAVVYFAPHPPIRQKMLNRLVSDTFYRELFMNPCLSGWDSGEEKHRYMGLCHEVLSRSHHQAIMKLQDAGIITRNLITLPNPSNISLANNGTHISLGSRTLTAKLKHAPSYFHQSCEKYIGDLVIKIVEHFLPLFVGTYSAAPYRLDFWDFHPENVLGFLPHELDNSYLRLLWQRWKRKAGLKILGQPITPYGPYWCDKTLSVLLRLKGDYIPDFRLIDYLVVLPSTEESAALDGSLGNEQRVKKDLADLGIYDERMSMYLLYKLRAFSEKGFCGYEGRYYSLFENFSHDMAEAGNLQILMTALAHKYITRFEVTHDHIPDIPLLESERRQIFFGSALDVPTFYVRGDSQNQFLKKILSKTRNVRMSRRFPAYLRVHHFDYRKALIRILREDAADLIEAFGFQETVKNLEARIDSPQEVSAFGKLTRGIMKEAGGVSPLSLSGNECNAIAEQFYRNTLRRQHMEEAWQLLVEEVISLELRQSGRPAWHQVVRSILGREDSVVSFLDAVKEDVMAERLNLAFLTKLIHLILATIHFDSTSSPVNHPEGGPYELEPASIY